MTENLPKGVSMRGTSYRVSVMQQGRRVTGTYNTLREAVEALEVIRAGGDPARRPEAPWTFLEAYTRVVEDHVNVVAQSTRGAYSKKSNHKRVMEFFGANTLLNHVNQQDVIKFRKWMVTDKRYAPSYCNNLLSSLSVMLDHARKCGGYTPKVALDMDYVQGKQGRIRFITDDEEARMFAWCKHFCAVDLQDLITLGLDTGMRVQEMLDTQYRDCDLGQRLIHIWRTKSGTTRSVPMTARVQRMIRDRTLKAGGSRKPGVLFGGMRYQTAQLQWDRMRTGVGLKDDPQFTIHVMRHTCATRLMSRGVDLRTVKEWLGHSDVRTTMRYAQFVPNNLFSAVQTLEQTSVQGAGETKLTL